MNDFRRRDTEDESATVGEVEGPVAGKGATPFGEGSFFAVARERSVRAERQVASGERRRSALILVALALVLVAALTVNEVRLWVRSDRDPSPKPSGLAFCSDFDRELRDAVERSVVQMRRTSEGERLFDELIAHEVCISFVELLYNSGYTWWELGAPRSYDAQIILDESVVLELHDDELAALLVHESTHAHRLFTGTSCYQTQDCEVLPNGVAVEEEVAAHLAEARFWIGIHGRTGTRSGGSWTGTSGSAYLNHLVLVAQEKPETFRAYVAELRSSPLEGQGINK